MCNHTSSSNYLLTTAQQHRKLVSPALTRDPLPRRFRQSCLESKTFTIPPSQPHLWQPCRLHTQQTTPKKIYLVPTSPYPFHGPHHRERNGKVKGLRQHNQRVWQRSYYECGWNFWRNHFLPLNKRICTQIIWDTHWNTSLEFFLQ